MGDLGDLDRQQPSRGTDSPRSAAAEAAQLPLAFLLNAMQSSAVLLKGVMENVLMSSRLERGEGVVQLAPFALRSTMSDNHFITWRRSRCATRCARCCARCRAPARATRS